MFALIPAAGLGSRMGASGREGSKALLSLSNGISIIELTLQAIVNAEVCRGIVVVCREDDERLLAGLSLENRFGLPLEFVRGGETRQESVYSGLVALEGRAEYVLVHDGARPCCPVALIRDVTKRARATDAAILAVPAQATLKRSSDCEIIQATIPRHDVWLAQTPQVFRFELLFAAHKRARETGFSATDDSELVERIGGEVMLVRGSEHNIKITTPDDLELVNAFVAREQRELKKVVNS